MFRRFTRIRAKIAVDSNPKTHQGHDEDGEDGRRARLLQLHQKDTAILLMTGG